MSAHVAVLVAVAPGTARVLIYGSLLMVAIVAGGIVVTIWLRRMVRRGQDIADQAGFSIEHLEKIHRLGQISDEEFRRLRKFALGIENQTGEKGDSPLSCRASDDDDKDG